MYALGVDLGTTYTAAAVWRDGTAEVVPLGDRAPVVPSVLLLRDDGAVLVGEPAVRRGLVEPLSVAREFKRRLGDPVPLLLAGRPLSAQALMARLLTWVVREVSTREGAPPDRLVVTCPANWGPHRRELLDLAVGMADVGPAEVVSEPVAAAVHVASTQRFADGALLAVYDLGGGTFDAAVLRKRGDSAPGLLRAGPAGIEHLGGVDFDAAVFAHVVRALGPEAARLQAGDEATLAAVARLQRDCTEAKEALSADSETVIPVTLPDLVRPVRLTRAEFEELIRPALIDTVLCLRRAMTSARVGPEQLAAVVLAGGSSRIPLVAELLGTELGRPIAVTTYPKSSVALGAARLAGADLPARAVPTDAPRRAPGAAPGRGSRRFGRRTPTTPPPTAAPPVDLPIDPLIDPGPTQLIDPGPAAPGGPGPGGDPAFHDATRPPGRAGGTEVTGGPSRQTLWLAGGAVALLLVGTVAAVNLFGGGGDDRSGGRSATSGASASTSASSSSTTTTTPGVVLPGTWSTGPDLPVPREAAGAATFQAKVWVAGGHQGDILALDSVQVYDPASDSWSAGPKLPVPLHDAALAADDRNLYVIGGQRADGTVESRVLVLNDQQDGWREGPSLPEGRVAGAAVFDGGRILYAGGNSGRGDRTEVWALAGGDWVKVGDLHVPRNSLVAVSDNAGSSWS